MMREIATATNGTWKVHGIFLAPTDSIFDTIKKAIESDKDLRQDYLQEKTGHHGPILISRIQKEIRFLSF